MSDNEPHPLVEALRKKVNHLEDRLETVERENDHLQDRVAELESRTDLSMMSYKEMSRQERVQRLRQYALEQAKDSNGKASMKYDAVISLFNGEPAAGTAYNLMESAGSADGFNYDDRDGRPNRLTVDVAAVNDAGGLSHLNNATDANTTA